MKVFLAAIGWIILAGWYFWPEGHETRPPENPLPTTQLEEWYQGGSLHGSTLAQWSAATERNKLATASDWIVIVLGENQVRKMAMLKKKARVVVSCIDTLAPIIGKSYDLKEGKATSVSLLCITHLESNNWQ